MADGKEQDIFELLDADEVHDAYRTETTTTTTTTTTTGGQPLSRSRHESFRQRIFSQSAVNFEGDDIDNDDAEDGGGSDMVVIAMALASPLAVVEKLWLDWECIQDEGIYVLARLGLQRNQSLRKLYLQGNAISNPGARALAETLKSCYLQEIDLGSNEIGDAGAEALAEALRSSSSSLSSSCSLQSLDLYNNRITHRGAQVLAEALVPNNDNNNNNTSRLRSLNLGFNRIESRGAQALAKAIAASGSGASLEKLNLVNNDIGDVGIEALAQALQMNSTGSLRVLNLDHNFFGDVGARALANAIRRNTSLQELYISETGLDADDEEAEDIVNALRSNGSLQVLGHSLALEERWMWMKEPLASTIFGFLVRNSQLSAAKVFIQSPRSMSETLDKLAEFMSSGVGYSAEIGVSLSAVFETVRHSLLPHLATAGCSLPDDACDNAEGLDSHQRRSV